ncbi:MAG TPA: NAD+ synthase [Bacteroidales bacterium]|nr:NAD+ synthase [Bacteroidales bacterium]
MKIAIAQLNYQVGNFLSNTNKIIKAINDAKKLKCDIVVFSELAVCGYPPKDFLLYQSFIDKSYDSIKEIAQHCDNITAIIGAPEINENKKGKPLYNSAFVISGREIISVIRKTLLPDYDVFDEYFESNKFFNVVKINGLNIALTICEDLWDVQARSLYVTSPMENLIKQKPDIIINIAASPFSVNQLNIREDILSANAKKYNLPLIYVNQVGAQTDLIFDGSSSVFNSLGEKICQLPFFEEKLEVIDIDQISYLPSLTLINKSEIALVHDALIFGIKDYFAKMNFTKAILGLSGGLDSAVCLVLATKALGKENVKALLLPSQFSSEYSITDAINIADNIGCDKELISIKEIYDCFENTLKPYFKNLPFNIAEENIQSRIRAVILMAFSNKFGYILLNTSNKSELAVGYGTLYGDMCGGLSVLGDVYKTKVYELAYFINKHEEVIPKNIILKPPSAELRPNQKDTDSLPEYSILDKILYYYIEENKTPQEIVNNGFNDNLVRYVINMVNAAEYKRAQFVPILRVTSKAFGIGRRIPIEGKYCF